MFFDGIELQKRKAVSIKIPPPTPETNWRPPTHFPNLSNAVAIGLDTETKDPDLTTHGPGWSRGPKGHIVGVSLAAIDRQGETGAWYFPIRHEVDPHLNLDAASVLRYVKSIVETKTDKIGTNLMYDLGWLGEEGINVTGRLNDISFAQALIDEQSKTSLEYCAQTYLGEGKISDTLYEWCATAYGGTIGDQRANIYRTSPKLVGPYAEADALKPIQILSKQWDILTSEELTELYDHEHRLIPLLIKMRRDGVRVDVDRAEQLLIQGQKDAVALRAKLSSDVGFQVNPNSPKDCARAFDHYGLEYPKTKDGNPSFPKEFLSEIEHPVGKAINEVRAIEKVCSTFLRNYILEGHVNGRLHCQFHPLRTQDDYDNSSGAKTGRFSSSDPNLQNIPVRTKIGKKVRTCFIPEEGHKDWRKRDYSQIEYRMLAHFAVDSGDGSAERLRQTYIQNPKTDYHDSVFKSYCALVGLDYERMSKEEKSERRKPIKNVNFGLLYGQSAPSLAYKSGMTPAQGKEFFIAYHKTASYVKPTMDAVTGEVNFFGYVRTIKGRRTRFNLWQHSHDHKSIALPHGLAIKNYGYSIQRAYAYRGTNYKFQGSAAEVIKDAMVAAYESGVFDVIGYPKLQVHDELDFSGIDDSPAQVEAYRHLDHILETTTPCRVPIIVSASSGANWGEAD